MTKILTKQEIGVYLDDKQNYNGIQSQYTDLRNRPSLGANHMEARLKQRQERIDRKNINPNKIAHGSSGGGGFKKKFIASINSQYKP